MTTLRVLLSAPPDPDRADAWALFDAAGRRISQGRSTPAKWPAADALEAVVAAEAVRIVSLHLPPMPASRRMAAATFALEDQLAGPVEGNAVVLDAPAAEGAILARVTARSLLAALDRHAPRFARIVAEPDLAPPGAGWRWCGRDDGGFVRRADGSAFPVGPRGSDGDLPPELAIALAQATRAGTMPAEVSVELPVDSSDCGRWSERVGIAFRAGAPWRWDDAKTFSRAPDLRAALAPERAGLPRGSLARLFVPAAALCALALLLHVAATAGTWVAQRIELARTERALVDVAAQAGVRDATVENAAANLAREHAARRHRAGLAAPGDALPLLARAAPAVAALPAGSLKSASYAARAWTFDLAAIDDTTLSTLVHRIAADGVPVVQARSASGVRVRMGPAP